MFLTLGLESALSPRVISTIGVTARWGKQRLSAIASSFRISLLSAQRYCEAPGSTVGHKSASVGTSPTATTRGFETTDIERITGGNGTPRSADDGSSIYAGHVWCEHEAYVMTPADTSIKLVPVLAAILWVMVLFGPCGINWFVGNCVLPIDAMLGVWFPLWIPLHVALPLLVAGLFVPPLKMRVAMSLASAAANVACSLRNEALMQVQPALFGFLSLVPSWGVGFLCVSLPELFLRAGMRTVSGYCDRCGYCLTGLPESRCPECGTPFRSPVGGDSPSRDP